MKLLKHTDGPWEVVGETIIPAPCLGGGYVVTAEERAANRRLLAAAPELLAALLTIRNALLGEGVGEIDMVSSYDKMRAAIQKAIGKEEDAKIMDSFYAKALAANQNPVGEEPSV